MKEQDSEDGEIFLIVFGTVEDTWSLGRVRQLLCHYATFLSPFYCETGSRLPRLALDLLCSVPCQLQRVRRTKS